MSDQQPEQDPDTIDLAPTPEAKAWYGGMAAGAEALKFSDAAGDNFDAQLGLYWLFIGTNFHERFPEGTGPMHTKFTEGAALHAPTRPKPLVQITIDDAVADYYIHGDGEVDESRLAQGLEAILATIAGRFGREDVMTGVTEHRQGASQPWAKIEFNL